MPKYPPVWVFVVCFGLLGWMVSNKFAQPASTSWQAPNFAPLLRTINKSPENIVFGILYFGVIPFALKK